jgi:hypothetical protein
VVVVADEALQLAPVDVVEGLAVGPGEFEVVDFEAAVWGDPACGVSVRERELYCGRGG